jgi:hypothetical protein
VVSNFRVARLEESSVFNLYLQREEIWLDPPYQRAADIWPLEKKQLLIDSLLNGFDIPKFYFHDFFPGASPEDENHRFAIIDGKQRLSTIWSYIDGQFALGDSIELLNTPEVDVRGLTYSELELQHPRLKAAFDSRHLSVVTIQAQDPELIEEMFSRLNEAVPLSAAEKRNALRGPIPPAIRSLSVHPFFTRSVPFNNSRYRHFDAACKFLYLVEQGEVVDLKKVYLDDFVIRFRDGGLTAEASDLRASVEGILDRMTSVFTQHDPLLQQIGMMTLYFILYAGLEEASWGPDVSRSELAAFEQARLVNRRTAEADVREASYTLLEFDRYAQSPNDGVALDFRSRVLTTWLSERRNASGD